MSVPVLILLILGSIIVSLVLAKLFVPKGNKFHELSSLPFFWYQLFKFRLQPMWEKRYFYGKQRRQYLLFLQPENKKVTKNHIIIYLHGGAWILGKPEFFRPNAQCFVKQGYGVILPSYRRVPRYNYYDVREDVNMIMNCIQEIMKEHKLEDKKIILGGVSAGGHLAAHWLYNRMALEQCGWSQDRFSGIFMLASPLDLEKMKKNIVLHFYTKGSKTKQLKDASPISYLKDDEYLPLLCIQGQRDGLVPYDSAITFIDRYKEINKNLVQLHTLENATHLDTSRWAYQDDDVKKLILDWVNELDQSFDESIGSTNRQFNKSTTV